MGRQAEAALRLFVSDINSAGGIRIGAETRDAELICIDDASDSERCAEIYRSLAGEKRAGVILGPYSSRLARAAAPIVEQAGMVMVNHGGADDDLYTSGYRMMVGVLSPASDYMRGFVHLLAGLKFWRKRLAIVAGASGFARSVANGIERECAERYARRKGVRIRVKYTGDLDPGQSAPKLLRALTRNRVNALVSAGSYEHDLALMRAVIVEDLNIPVLACVAAGVEQFGHDLGDGAEGIVGCSQWEEDVEVHPEIGPSAREFARRMRRTEVSCDYPAAQAYAAGLLTAAAIAAAGSLDQQRLRDAFSELRTTTLYGDFAIDRVSGRQIGHKVLLIQWHGGHKVIIQPEPGDSSGALEFPSGWRLIVASLHTLKLRRYERAKERDDDESD